MIKPLALIVSGVLGGSAALVGLCAPSQAGPYVNVEVNSGFDGAGDGLAYVGSGTDIHIGVDGGNDVGSWYVQGGPAIMSANGESSEFEFSGKAGGSVGLSEKLSVYGEVSFATVDEFDYANFGTKFGATYAF